MRERQTYGEKQRNEQEVWREKIRPSVDNSQIHLKKDIIRRDIEEIQGSWEREEREVSP